MTAPQRVLALDVGGTKMAAGLVAPDGTIEHGARRPTPVTEDPEVLWHTVTEVVADTLGAAGEAGGDASYTAVGIGCGGPMTWPEGEVSPLNIPGWRGFPLLARVRERYAGDRPAAIHNDAVAMALAESRWGAARGARAMIGIVVSTGVGAGIVLAGRPLDGGTGNAGHLGHLVVEPDGDPCPCGGRGCLEPIARGPGIAAHAVALGWTGEATGVAVAAGARAGDPACAAAFTRAGRAVGIAIASAAAVLDLDVAVIGGGVGTTGELLLAPVRAAFDEHAGLAFVRRCRIEPAALGSDAGVAGAAALVLDPA